MVDCIDSGGCEGDRLRRRYIWWSAVRERMRECEVWELVAVDFDRAVECEPCVDKMGWGESILWDLESC